MTERSAAAATVAWNLMDRLWLWWKLRQLAPGAPVPHNRPIDSSGVERRLRATKAIANSAKAKAMTPLMEGALQRKIEIALLDNIVEGMAKRHGAEVLEPLLAAMRAAATASDRDAADRVAKAAGPPQWIELCNAAKLLAEQRHPRAVHRGQERRSGRFASGRKPRKRASESRPSNA